MAVACLAQSGRAQTVSIRQGDIYLTLENGKDVQLTSGGADSDAVLSPTGKKIIFVRVMHDQPDASGPGRPGDRGEIVYIELNSPTPEVHVLLDAPADATGTGFQWFSSPRYSFDEGLVYFLVPDYSPTSPGLFSLDLKSGKILFVVQAQKFWVPPAGPYKGDLVVWQNPTLVGGGRYDVFNLIKPSGEVIGVVGFDEEKVKALLEDDGSGSAPR